jgi:threonine dehydratase
MSDVAVSLGDVEQAAARLDGVAVRTPLLTCDDLNGRLQARVFIKPESLQHIGAFKFRGAYNRLVQLSDAQRQPGVVAFSSGNHAQGIAYAAQLLGMPATIVMPSDAPQIKLDNTRRLGATVRLYERRSESREQIAADIARDTGATLVPAFDDADIIAGQGTCGLEIMDQLAQRDLRPDWVISPVGGGGLLSGVTVAVKSREPDAKVAGVEPENFDDHARSRAAGERVAVSGTATTLCDSLMAPTPGELTWSITGRQVDDFIVVSEDDVAHAISYAFKHMKLVVEPGGVVALAALLQGKLDVAGATVAVILSGGNIDATTFCRCLEQYPNP